MSSVRITKSLYHIELSWLSMQLTIKVFQGKFVPLAISIYSRWGILVSSFYQGICCLRNCNTKQVGPLPYLFHCLEYVFLSVFSSFKWSNMYQFFGAFGKKSATILGRILLPNPLKNHATHQQSTNKYSGIPI